MTENVAQQGVISPDMVPVTFIDSTDQALHELEVLKNAAALAIDTETVILRDEDGEMIKVDLDVDGPGPWRVMSIATRSKTGEIHAFVLDMGYVDPHAIAHLFVGLRPFGWNAKFDRFVLTRGGIGVFDWWDLMINEAVLRQGAAGGNDRKYTSLSGAARKYLGIELEGKNSVRLNYATVKDSPKLSEAEVKYAALDAIVTLLLAAHLGAKAREAGLVPTFVVEANADPFIQMMIRAGLPINADGYREEVENARKAAATAAEMISVSTTGSELLSTLYNWAKTQNFVTDTERDQIEVGLELLHNPEIFTEFIESVREAQTQSLVKMGALLGASEEDDLFGENKFVPLPFLSPAEETKLRSWLSITAPHITAAFVLADREEGDLGELLALEEAQVLELAGRKRKLTKANDLEVFLSTVIDIDHPQATETLKGVAKQLLAWRRYERITSAYADVALDKEMWLVPDWNINSDVQVKQMLNTYFPDLVQAYLANLGSRDKELGSAHSVNADALKLIGGPLSKSLLAYREQEKLVTTNGDKMLELINPTTGRIHAKYTHGLVGTGRLASFNPNAQNLSPRLKPYLTPDNSAFERPRRVLCAADLSQAELRFVADQAQDEAMMEAFFAGDDLHQRTAGLMFSLDMKTLKSQGKTAIKDIPAGLVEGLDTYQVEQPDTPAIVLHDTLRKKAKAVAFGYAYGLKGASLANQLTVQGVPTTKEEADGLLESFDVAYPQVAAWMAVRVAFIKNIADSMRSAASCPLDFEASWLLHQTHSRAHAAKRQAQKKLGYYPSLEEVAYELKPDYDQGDEASVEKFLKVLSWVLSHEHSLMLDRNGKPWEFESRTNLGRRRIFQMTTKDLVMAVVIQIVRSNKPHIMEIKDTWVDNYNARLMAAFEAEGGKGRKPTLFKLPAPNKGRVDLRAVEKTFEDRDLRNDLVGFAISKLGGSSEAMASLWRGAASDRVRAMGNQYRNHPIQGGVADAVLIAYGELVNVLRDKFPTAKAIQSVHDSIVIECDVEQSREVLKTMTEIMEKALARFCPTVPCVADGDIMLSLDDKKDKLSDEQVDELISYWKQQELQLVS